MGADIYLNSVHEKHTAKWRPIFDEAVRVRDTKFPKGSDPKAVEASAEQAAVEKAFEQLNAEGYFRDSYNCTSLFHLYDLSWWQSGYIDQETCEMPVAKMKELRDFLIDNPVEPRMAVWVTKQQADRFGPDFTKDGNSPKDWEEMFVEKRANLIALLTQAIDLDEPLYCSV